MKKCRHSSPTEIAIHTVRFEVENTLEEAWTVDQMAARAGISPGYFAHVFSHLFTEAPMVWLTRLRLEQAALWLKYSLVPTAEIAPCVGYQSREGFGRAFVRQFGMSPGRFRNQAHHRLVRMARRPAVRRAALPVQICHRAAEPVIGLRHTGPYHNLPAVWNCLRQWACKSSLLMPNLRCVGVNYDESDITAPHHLRYDAGLIPPPVGPWPHFMRLFTLPEGLYACAEFQGNARQLMMAWNWFIAIWLPASGFYVRKFGFFDEHAAETLLKPPLTLLNLMTRQYHARLFIPVSAQRELNAMPVSKKR